MEATVERCYGNKWGKDAYCIQTGVLAFAAVLAQALCTTGEYVRRPMGA